MSAPTGHAESCKCSVLPSVYLTDIVSYFPSDSVVTLHGCVTVLSTSLCVVFEWVCILSQGYIQDHHQRETHGEEDGTQVGVY